jgi:hypothetical protein
MFTSALLCLSGFILLIISDRDPTRLELMEVLSYAIILCGMLIAVEEIFNEEEGS